MSAIRYSYMVNHVIKGTLFIRLDDLGPDGKPTELNVGEIEIPIAINMSPFIPDTDGL